MTFRESTTPQWPPLSFEDKRWKQEEHCGSKELYFTTSRYSVPRDSLDLARATPPLSPKDTGWSHYPQPNANVSQTCANETSIAALQTYPDNISPFETSPEAFMDTILVLEEGIGNFPSIMFLPDMPCISAIRSHLVIVSPQPRSPTHNTHLPSNVDCRPERWTSHEELISHERGLHRAISLSTISTFRTISAPKSSSNLSQSMNIFEPNPFQLPHFSTTSADSSLRAIFPNSTSFLRAALYSHIIVYAFLDSLASPKESPQISGIPNIFTKTSHALPPKVAKVLGAPPMAPRPARIQVRKGSVVVNDGAGGVEISRIEKLRERSRGCIGWLTVEMENPNNPNNKGSQEVRVDGLVLRALVELVRGCEQNLNVYV